MAHLSAIIYGNAARINEWSLWLSVDVASGARRRPARSPPLAVLDRLFLSCYSLYIFFGDFENIEIWTLLSFVQIFIWCCWIRNVGFFKIILRGLKYLAADACPTLARPQRNGMRFDWSISVGYWFIWELIVRNVERAPCLLPFLNVLLLISMAAASYWWGPAGGSSC